MVRKAPGTRAAPPFRSHRANPARSKAAEDLGATMSVYQRIARWERAVAHAKLASMSRLIDAYPDDILISLLEEIISAGDLERLARKKVGAAIDVERALELLVDSLEEEHQQANNIFQ